MRPKTRREDLPAVARETSDALAGEAWVGAGIRARFLLVELADEVERLGAEVARLTAERDALIVAADCVVGLHSALDGNMDNDVSQDAIDRLAALLPSAAGPGAAGEGT
jgi:hypothetical protein